MTELKLKDFICLLKNLFEEIAPNGAKALRDRAALGYLLSGLTAPLAPSGLFFYQVLQQSLLTIRKNLFIQ